MRISKSTPNCSCGVFTSVQGALDLIERVEAVRIAAMFTAPLTSSAEGESLLAQSSRLDELSYPRVSSQALGCWVEISCIPNFGNAELGGAVVCRSFVSR